MGQIRQSETPPRPKELPAMEIRIYNESYHHGFYVSYGSRGAEYTCNQSTWLVPGTYHD